VIALYGCRDCMHTWDESTGALCPRCGGGWTHTTWADPAEPDMPRPLATIPGGWPSLRAVVEDALQHLPVLVTGDGTDLVVEATVGARVGMELRAQVAAALGAE